jgi:hypothetical protein
MFYTTAIEHSPTSATGTGWERTPWHATQRAAWEALETQEERLGVAAVTGAPGLLHHCLSRLAVRRHSSPRVRRSILYRSYMQGSHPR